MTVEILSQQKVVGVPKRESGGLKVGVVEPQSHGDGTIYRVDIRYESIVFANQDDNLTFQRSLGGSFDGLLIKSVEERARTIQEEIRKINAKP